MKMREEIEKAVKALTVKSTDTRSASDSLHFTQAALNLAHVLQCLKEVKTI